MGATLHDEAVMFEPAKKGTLAFRFVIIANIAVVNRLIDRQASVGSVSQLAQIERCLEHRTQTVIVASVDQKQSLFLSRHDSSSQPLRTRGRPKCQHVSVQRKMTTGPLKSEKRRVGNERVRKGR